MIKIRHFGNEQEHFDTMLMQSTRSYQIISLLQMQHEDASCNDKDLPQFEKKEESTGTMYTKLFQDLFQGKCNNPVMVILSVSQLIRQTFL